MNNSAFDKQLNDMLFDVALEEALKRALPMVRNKVKRDTNQKVIWEKEYDAKDRQILHKTPEGYWSRHVYWDHADHTECFYFNSKGKQVRQMFDKNGKLIWVEEKEERWYVLVDQYPRLYGSSETGLLKTSGKIGSAEDLAYLISQGRLKVPNKIRSAISGMIRPKLFNIGDNRENKRCANRLKGAYRRVRSFFKGYKNV
jgi:hypothetical protein